MAKFSTVFKIGKTQAELDFVDVRLSKDNLVFVDPFAIAQRPERWSHECHLSLTAFFQRVIDDIRAGHHNEARQLLSYLREPNETRLGFSAGRPQGAGIGKMQAEQLYEALKGSAAVKTGFLSSLEECELMIEGIGRDKVSDLTTNVIRNHLVEYTKDQCTLLGVPLHQVPLSPCFDAHQMTWISRYAELPVWRGRPIVLIPKAIVRFDPAYEHGKYYRHFVLPFLQAEHLRANSSLVHTLKSGAQRVYKKDLEARFPNTKDFLYKFSKKNPKVLRKFRKTLEKLEKVDRQGEVDPEDEGDIAGALIKALKSIKPGSEQATAYHTLMIGIVEFLFFPKLLYPRKEQEIHEGRKRIDIVMENGAHTGTFYYIPTVRKLPCAYVPFECKNYTTEVANPEIDQLSGRFSVNTGMLGFLCCRHFENRDLFVQRCRDTFKDGRGLILPLEDRTILHFLSLVEKGERKELDKELARLVGEVWLS